MINRFYFFFLMSLFLLPSCGQKGALYVAENPQTAADTTNITLQKPYDSNPELLTLPSLTIVGTVTKVRKNTVPEWQAALNQDVDNNNLIRYAVIKNNLLGKQLPFELLIGKVNNEKTNNHKNNNKDDAKTDTTAMISAGRYLRFRSRDKGSQHLPLLREQARNYLVTASYQRSGNLDFILKNENFIDLYIAVEAP